MPIKYAGFRDSHGQSVQAMRVGNENQTTILGVDATATSVILTAPVVRMVANVGCHINTSATGTAVTTATGMFLPANVVEYIVIDHAKGISCITATGGTGELFLTEAL